MYGLSASPRLIPLFFLLLITHTFSAQAVTTLVSPSIYSVTQGVAFSISTSGSSDFLFSWTDPFGTPAKSFTNIADPTLRLTIGQTYNFQRTSGLHPFVIMNNTAAAFMSGTDGAYNRTTSSSTDISNATLTPIANFTADPAPTSDLISWTPSQSGDFWYTCSVTGHPAMTGKIAVAIPEPSALSLLLLSLGALSLRRRH
jgi:hypothetical protein